MSKLIKNSNFIILVNLQSKFRFVSLKEFTLRSIRGADKNRVSLHRLRSIKNNRKV